MGLLVNSYSEECRASNQNKDVSNDKVLVVGGTQGIGLAIAKKFALKGASVIIAGRNEKRGENAARELGPNVRYIQADVGTVRPALDFVERIKREIGQIDYLYNTAGVTPSGFFENNSDGLDKGFALQCLGRFTVTTGLCKNVNKAICIVAAPSLGSSVDTDDLSMLHSKYRNSFWPIRMYRQAARDSTYLDATVKELSERNPQLSVLHVFPGAVFTNVAQNAGLPYPLQAAWKLFGPYLFPSPDDFAEVPVHLSLTQGAGAKFFNWRGTPWKPTPFAYEDDNSKKIWQASNDMIASVCAKQK